MNMNMNMNIYMNIGILILMILAIFSNKLESFIETATYLGKVIINEDVECKKNVNVDDTVYTNQLCIDDVCIDKNKLNFIKQLPLTLKNAVCIGDTCVNENSFKAIKELTRLKLNNNGKDIFVQMQK